MITPATYYEAHCDEPGCGEQYDCDILSAWATQEGIEEELRDDENWTLTDEGKVFCYSHRPPEQEK